MYIVYPVSFGHIQYPEPVFYSILYRTMLIEDFLVESSQEVHPLASGRCRSGHCVSTSTPCWASLLALVSKLGGHPFLLPPIAKGAFCGSLCAFLFLGFHAVVHVFEVQTVVAWICEALYTGACGGRIISRQTFLEILGKGLESIFAGGNLGCVDRDGEISFITVGSSANRAVRQLFSNCFCLGKTRAVSFTSSAISCCLIHRLKCVAEGGGRVVLLVLHQLSPALNPVGKPELDLGLVELLGLGNQVCEARVLPSVSFCYSYSGFFAFIIRPFLLLFFPCFFLFLSCFLLLWVVFFSFLHISAKPPRGLCPFSLSFPFLLSLLS